MKTVVAAALVVAVFTITPTANAKPIIDSSAVCEALDLYPTFDGIAAIGTEIVRQSRGTLTWDDAGQAILSSVYNTCPRHMALLQRFINANQPQGTLT